MQLAASQLINCFLFQARVTGRDEVRRGTTARHWLHANKRGVRALRRGAQKYCNSVQQREKKKSDGNRKTANMADNRRRSELSIDGKSMKSIDGKSKQSIDGKSSGQLMANQAVN